jgi:hypothetical protein
VQRGEDVIGGHRVGVVAEHGAQVAEQPDTEAGVYLP